MLPCALHNTWTGSFHWRASVCDCVCVVHACVWFFVCVFCACVGALVQSWATTGAWFSVASDLTLGTALCAWKYQVQSEPSNSVCVLQSTVSCCQRSMQVMVDITWQCFYKNNLFGSWQKISSVDNQHRYVCRYVAESITTDAGRFSHAGLCQLRTKLKILQ